MIGYACPGAIVEKPRLEGLDAEQNLEHEHREWRLQRLGWILCAVFLGAAALGLTGPGPLNRSRAAAAGLELGYGRVLHLGDPNVIELTLTEPADTVWFDEGWFASMQVDSVWPVPERTSVERGRVFLTFPRSASERLVIRLRVRARRPGVLRGEVGVDENTVSFRQTVLP